MCLLCWILMHWKQDLYEIEYLYSRWERSRLALALGRHSANHSHTSESQLPSCEKREKLCPREKFNVLQTNSKLFCIYSYHFIFCAKEGAAGASPRVLWSLLFRRLALLPLVYELISWATMDCDFISPNLQRCCCGGRGGQAMGEGRPSAAPAQVPGRRASWQVESEGMGHFPRFYIGQFTILDFSYCGDLF